MNMYKAFFIFIFIFILKDVNGQDIPPSLVKNIKLIDVAYTPSEQYAMTYWESDFGKNACEDESCPLRRLQIFDAELTHQDGQCKVFVYVSGANSRYYKTPEENNPDLFNHPPVSSYNRIKSDFMYGQSYRSAKEREIKDLDMMLYYYPQDSAKAVFNADFMVSYPYNMEGKKCKDHLSCGRVIVTGKKGLDIFVCFFMTDESAENFEKYLADFKQTLWFED